MTDASKSARIMPKGGRKGGAVFPRISLEKAFQYAVKLVSKTHTGPQSTESIFAGVVNTKGGDGATRISALRQYSLLEGTNKSGLKATQFARQLVTAPEQERPILLRKACLNPKIFNLLFETFHGDTVNKAKLRQRASALNVHPDELDNCIYLFFESAKFSLLGRAAGDQLNLISKIDANSGSDRRGAPDESDATITNPTEFSDSDVTSQTQTSKNEEPNA